jgi:Pheromone A receptor
LLDYVVQGHRYNVYEDLGPVIETYDVTLAFPLFFIIDPTICIIEAVFGIMTLWILITRRKEMDEALATGSPNVNKNHFVRLLCLSASAVAFHLPLALWVALSNAITYQVAPWISWEDTHSDYGRIGYYDRTIAQANPQFVSSASVMLFGTTLSALIYFFLFGFGEAAMTRYRSFIGAILRPFGIKYPREKKRNEIKRTWYDDLLGRFGKSPNTPTPSMTQLNVNPSKARISGIPQVTIVSGLVNDSTGLPPSLGSSLNGDTYEKDHGNDSIVERETRDTEWGDFKATSEPSMKSRLDDSDLESQVPSQAEVQSARRRAMLEKNPELTEEVTF